jgi:hypothetical protein
MQHTGAYAARWNGFTRQGGLPFHKGESVAALSLSDCKGDLRG